MNLVARRWSSTFLRFAFRGASFRDSRNPSTSSLTSDSSSPSGSSRSTSKRIGSFPSLVQQPTWSHDRSPGSGRTSPSSASGRTPSTKRPVLRMVSTCANPGRAARRARWSRRSAVRRPPSRGARKGRSAVRVQESVGPPPHVQDAAACEAAVRERDAPRTVLARGTRSTWARRDSAFRLGRHKRTRAPSADAVSHTVPCATYPSRCYVAATRTPRVLVR